MLFWTEISSGLFAAVMALCAPADKSLPDAESLRSLEAARERAAMEEKAAGLAEARLDEVIAVRKRAAGEEK